MRMRRHSSDQAEVSMSPLIDAVFLLLIFFLVATMLKKQDKDINITPPESRSAIKIPPDDNQLVIGIDAAGELFWEGHPTTLNLLHERLREIAAREPDRQIRLDADSAAAFDRVAEVLDVCQFRGMFNIGIRTYDERYNQR